MQCRHSIFWGCNCWEWFGADGTSLFKPVVAGPTDTNHDMLATARVESVDVEDRREDCNGRHRMGMDNDDPRDYGKTVSNLQTTTAQAMYCM